MEKNGTPASPATALATKVLPVPGGPTSRMPLGIRAPRRLYLGWSLRKETISSSSALASSMPATSSKVTPVSRSTYTLALDLPTLTRPPRPCLSVRRRNRKLQKAKISTSGSSQDSRLERAVFSLTALNLAPAADSSSASAGSTRLVTKLLRLLIGSRSLPLICWLLMLSSLSLPSLSSARNSL
ncbi:hypothetical protein D3C75_824950 [compost metagenome]